MRKRILCNGRGATKQRRCEARSVHAAAIWRGENASYAHAPLAPAHAYTGVHVPTASVHVRLVAQRHHRRVLIIILVKSVEDASLVIHARVHIRAIARWHPEELGQAVDGVARATREGELVGTRSNPNVSELLERVSVCVRPISNINFGAFLEPRMVSYFYPYLGN